jgi:hypothetical protein
MQTMTQGQSTAATKRRSQLNRKSSFISVQLDQLNVFNQHVHECVESGELGKEQMNETRARLEGFMQDLQRSGTAPHEGFAMKLLALKKKLQYEKDTLKAEFESGLDTFFQNVSNAQDQFVQEQNATLMNEKLLAIQDLSLKTDKLVDHYDYIKQVPIYHYWLSLWF